MNTVLWLVAPCYNEEDILNHSCLELGRVLTDLQERSIISKESKILFVDDGSSDSTWDIIEKGHISNDNIIGIRLSHNQGHQNALLAGMMYAMNKCDCIISLDADLLDDIMVIPKFLEEYEKGSEIVYGIRDDRSQDTFFKRGTAHLFYRLMNALGAEIKYNHADYRLMSNRALKALSTYSEVNLFLRGIVPLIGMKYSEVRYTRKERVAGKTKYPLKKMIGFAADGITSFSVKPLRMISIMGVICSLLSIFGLGYALVSYFCGNTVPGWTAIVCSIWLLGGIQLMCIGVVGEYIGKIFSEVKHRPKYFIDKELR